MGDDDVTSVLSALMADAREGGYGRKVLASHLAAPWHWPSSAGAGRELHALCGERRPHLPPGAVVLAGVEDGRRGWAWSMAPGKDTGAVRLDEAARASLARARGLALTSLPVVNPALAERAAWCFRPLGGSAAERPSELKGASFGASFFLAAASLTLGRPVPVDLVALAALGPGNRLAPVDGLKAKLRLLQEQLPGVRHVVVAREQAPEAARLAAKLGGLLRVKGVVGLGGLVTTAFPRGLLDVVSEDQLAARVEALFSFAVTSAPHAAWRGVWSGVALYAQALLSRGTLGGREAARLSAVLNIARRNTVDERREELPSLELVGSGTSRIVQLRYLAHQLQSVCDGGFGDLRASVALVQRELPRTPRQATSDELVLFGAVGRGLARVRAYAEAASLLEETCQAWREAGRLEEASLPACEWLRVAGLSAEPTQLERALAMGRLVACAPRTGEVSAAYLQLAVGRALVQQGHHEEGERELTLATRAEAMGMSDVAAGAWRWLARAASAQRNRSEARRLRAEAKRRAAPDIKALVAFDAAVERGEVPRGAVDRVAALKDFGHILREVPRPQWVSVISSESPY